MLLVKVDTDEGVTGWGEAFAYKLRDATRAALESTVIPRYVGRDPAQIAELALTILREFRNSKSGPLTFALSAIDIALWDILGKTVGLPLHQIVGGSGKKTLPTYASLLRFADPHVAAAGVAAIAERGYRHIKLHEDTFDPVAAARKEIGDSVSLMLDVSSAWSVRQAIVEAERLKDLNLVWLEEPTWPPEDYRALARVAGVSRLALAAGENVNSLYDFRVLCETAGLTFVQPSVAKIGGITEMRKALAIAEAHNLATVPHSYYLGPGLLASLHLIAARPEEILVEHAIFDIEAHPYAGALDVKSGAISVPQGHGVGPPPDANFLKRYARL